MRERRGVWEKRVERWQDSGLTAKEYAAEIGVNYQTLQHWKYRLRHDAAPEGAPASARSGPPTSTRTAATPVNFIELAAPVVAQREAVPFELELRGGLRVLVPAAFDDAALCRLLAVLEARA